MFISLFALKGLGNLHFQPLGVHGYVCMAIKRKIPKPSSSVACYLFAELESYCFTEFVVACARSSMTRIAFPSDRGSAFGSRILMLILMRHSFRINVCARFVSAFTRLCVNERPSSSKM